MKPTVSIPMKKFTVVASRFVASRSIGGAGTSPNTSSTCYPTSSPKTFTAICDPGPPLRNYYHLVKQLNSKRRVEESLALQEIAPGHHTTQTGEVKEGSASTASLIVQECMLLANYTAVTKLFQYLLT